MMANIYSPSFPIVPLQYTKITKHLKQSYLTKGDDLIVPRNILTSGKEKLHDLSIWNLTTLDPAGRNQ